MAMQFLNELSHVTNWTPVWDKSEKSKNHPNIPSEFAMIIVGKRNTGKTSLALKICLEADFIQYDKIMIFSPNAKTNKDWLLLYHGFKNKLTKESIKTLAMMDKTNIKHIPIPELCEYYAKNYPEADGYAPNTLIIECILTDNISSIPPPQKLDLTKKNLVIFDDCLDVKNVHIMESYFTRGRHGNANVIFITQSLIDTSKHKIRGNANFFILFKQAVSNLTYFHRDFISNEMELADFKQFIGNIWTENEHGYLAINPDTNPVFMTDDIFRV